MSADFCISDFVTRMKPLRVSAQHNAFIGLAAVKFEQSPCSCEGCSQFMREFDALARDAGTAVER